MVRYDFTGKAVLVTGSSRGMGAAIVEAFARAGAVCLVHYVADADGQNRRDADDTAGRCRGHGATAHVLEADVRSYEAVEKLIREAFAAAGRLDILVNNAGVFAQTPIAELEPERWDALMAVNLRGVLVCSQAALRAMAAGGRGGAIVNLGSMAGQVGGVVAGADYAASKAGVIALTKSLAKQAAGLGVRANVVNPGVIDTAMPAQFPAAARERMVADTPLKRLGRAEEVAAAIAFLASDDASFITGAGLDVNGGLHMG
jgi:3-oxoacyl-[acyl-carrier protein] reductase